MERVMNRDRVIRVIGMAIVVMCLIMATIVPVFADANYGERIGSWIIEQSFWIALAVVAMILIPLAAKRAWVPTLITVIIAAIILAIISNPQRLVAIGEGLLSILN